MIITFSIVNVRSKLIVNFKASFMTPNKKNYYKLLMCCYNITPNKSF